MKTAYVPGIDGFAIKISPGFFDNPKLGLPSINGMMVLLSATTGLVEALLLDNGYLTDVRTAAAGAVAAKHLSREDSLDRRDLRRGRAGAAAARGADAGAADRRGAHLGARRRKGRRRRRPTCASGSASWCATSRSRDQAVAGADIIVTTTPATEPVLKAAWLWPGQHITAMGSDAEHKNEIEPAIVAQRRALCRRQPEPDAACSANCTTPSRRAWCRPTPTSPNSARSSPASASRARLAGRPHRRRPDRHRRAGHGHRHAGARPRQGGRRGHAHSTAEYGRKAQENEETPE